MLTLIKELWTFVDKASAICITTNGFVKKDGCAVMGKGCALEAKQLFRGIDQSLGRAIYDKGNVTQIIRRVPRKDDFLDIVSFPVKAILMKIKDENDLYKVLPNHRHKFPIGRTVPGFLLKADIGLIRTSLKQLTSLADEHEWKSVVLPRPGCGYGGLNWEQVKAELELYLDDRFTVVHK